jgi:hypothetical protein
VGLLEGTGQGRFGGDDIPLTTAAIVSEIESCFRFLSLGIIEDVTSDKRFADGLIPITVNGFKYCCYCVG